MYGMTVHDQDSQSATSLTFEVNRTGSHLGGAWVEVDEKGNGQAESNMETYTAGR